MLEEGEEEEEEEKHDQPTEGIVHSISVRSALGRTGHSTRVISKVNKNASFLSAWSLGAPETSRMISNIILFGQMKTVIIN